MPDSKKFEAWMHRVDVLITKTAGIGVDDLTDQPYWDWYDNGFTPIEAAREALQDNGWTNA